MTRKIILLAMGIALVSVASAGTVALAVDPTTPANCSLFVARTGDDDNSGESEDQAFKTVQKLANVIAPGQMGCVRGFPKGSTPDNSGLYEESVTISRSGLSGQPLTIRSYPGEVAHLKGLLTVSGDRVTITDLVLDGRNTSNASSPKITGNNVTFEDNNVTSRNTAGCFLLHSKASGPKSSGTQIHRNRIHDCSIGVAVQDQIFAAVSENLIYDNTVRGIQLYPNGDLAVINRNIIDGNRVGLLYASNPGGADKASDSNVVHENIISYSTGWNMRATWAGTPPNQGMLNYFFNNCTYADSPGFDSNGGVGPSDGVTVSSNTIGEPRYENRSGKDFHIDSSSPCFGQAGDIAAAYDSGGGPTEAEAVNLRPNILFIVTDDQRADDTMHQMPNALKWFRDGGVDDGQAIAGGTAFTEAYATTPLCCPARASILSGSFAHNHGVRRNDEFEALSANAQVQSQLRNDAGYRTAIVGKYLNEWNTYLDPPGFDQWWLTSPGYQPHVNENGTITTPECDPPPCSSNTYSTNYIREKARSFIQDSEGSDSKPWFLYVAPNAPHVAGDHPYSEMNDPDSNWQWGPANYPSCEDAQNVPPCLPSPIPNPSRNEGGAGGNPIYDKPTWVQESSDIYNVFQPNEAGAIGAGGALRDQSMRALRSVDDMIQAVFEELQKTGEERDTLAIFVSDNGFLWREHGVAANELTKGGCKEDPAAENPVFRFKHCGLIAKDQPYTESIKIPFFMRWPGNLVVEQEHVESGRYVANIDLAPTALTAAGLPGGQMDGRSLLDGSSPRSEILTEDWTTVAGTWASLRGRTTWMGQTRHYQYIEYYESDGVNLRQECCQDDGGGLREYYDLDADRYQLNNLLRDGDPNNPLPGFIAYLRDKLRKARLCSSTNCSPADPPASVQDTSPPRVWIRSPTPGAVVTAPTSGDPVPRTVRFEADASDNVGVQRLEFWRDGNIVRTAFEPRDYYAQPWTPAETGPVTFRVVAYDHAQNRAESEITVHAQRFDVQAANPDQSGSREKGRIDEGDQITFHFDPGTPPSAIRSGWDGSPLTVNVRVRPDVDDPQLYYNDVLSVDLVPNLGQVDLGRNDYWGWRLAPAVDAVFSNSAIVMNADGRSVTLTLGQAGQTMPTAASGDIMIWRPSSQVCSYVTPCAVNESKIVGEASRDTDF